MPIALVRPPPRNRRRHPRLIPLGKSLLSSTAFEAAVNFRDLGDYSTLDAELYPVTQHFARMQGAMQQ